MNRFVPTLECLYGCRTSVIVYLGVGVHDKHLDLRLFFRVKLGIVSQSNRRWFSTRMMSSAFETSCSLVKIVTHRQYKFPGVE